MDNFNAIKTQWTSKDASNYPHLFSFVVDMIVKMKAEEERIDGK